jgi:hypothetical protein
VPEACKQCFCGVERGRCVGLTNSPPSSSPLSRQCGILNISQTCRLPRAVTGIAYFYPWFLTVRQTPRHLVAEIPARQLLRRRQNCFVVEAGICSLTNCPKCSFLVLPHSGRNAEGIPRKRKSFLAQESSVAEELDSILAAVGVRFVEYAAY